MKIRIPALLVSGLAALALVGCDSGGGTGSDDTAQAPNILLVIMDDVGIDQMKVFGYGGQTWPMMPNIDAVAHAGVRFRNTWSMPECSPGRASMFVGRYPVRTGIHQAIGPRDLATSQLSPYDVTAPKLLKRAGYESAMFGKFHLAGPDNNEAEFSTPSVLGWDYFYGWVDGLPGSIDRTVGGYDKAGTHVCGFIPGEKAGGAETGACYQPDGSCKVLSRTDLSQDTPGMQCVDSGGILVPNDTCGAPPSYLDFNIQNAYYVSPLVINDNGQAEVVSLSDPRARGYRTTIETDAAIEWINSRPANQAWMATVSYSAAHTPWQQPPKRLIPLAPHDMSPLDGLTCSPEGAPGTLHTRIIQDRMTEALDTEFGRLLVETGMAKYKEDGSLDYDPKATNTVIVIVGDNGSLGTAVKLPFDPTRAKGTAYQTGVWDPLIIAGPQVAEPDREVGHMVNTVDLFQFFGELAGLDAHQEVPHVIDSVGILPYLVNPSQASLRTINFAMGGLNEQANGGRNGPCVVGTSCTAIPTSKTVCEDNLGVYWGAGYDDPSVVPTVPAGAGYETCADVNEARYKATPQQSHLGLVPESTVAIRNELYKLVVNTSVDYDPASDSHREIVSEELYQINQAAPVPLLDTEDRNLLPSSDPQVEAIRQDLRAKLDDMLASSPDCPGDGNLDGVVNAQDVENWRKIAQEWGLSSVYDFLTPEYRDGITDHNDGAVIQANLNKTCERGYSIY
ncbi:sulfatase-like hydrolase/transferase [Pusillimonas sp. MFBS29]|uniref:sulfatase-like hydrolase/transferase n=1 Tax=Pusillimonas sp. MFBS29 TaxID=2886690 RepID=UPI001D10C431|nr:sulfatase-like hydrolase/transferase [Pusillimonas sp. MFBS29]MCC2596701.1 sulfatase-like hydrolase/transferase [Pusillimonas sp. MFBS29]